MFLDEEIKKNSIEMPDSKRQVIRTTMNMNSNCAVSIVSEWDLSDLLISIHLAAIELEVTSTAH